jgi:hypothetical protein
MSENFDFFREVPRTPPQATLGEPSKTDISQNFIYSMERSLLPLKTIFRVK